MSDKFKRYIYLGALFSSLFLFAVALVFRQQVFQRTHQIIFGTQTQQGGGLSKDNYITVLNNELLKSDIPGTKKGLIQKYCQTVLGDQLGNGFTNNGFKYDPKKSVLLYNMCGFVQPDLKDKFDQKFKAHIKDFDLSYFRSSFKQFQSCDPSGDLESCQIIMFMSKVYGGIMNEFANIKTAALYGYTDPNAQVPALIEKFSNTYFGQNVCAGKFYLYTQPLEGTNENFCSHPRTAKILGDFISNIKVATANTKFVNTEELLQLSNGGCDQKDMFKCAFMVDKAHWTNFRNLYYNELLYYNMFVSYYAYAISLDPSYQKFEVTSNIGSKFDEMNAEIAIAQKEITISQKSMYQVERMLRNMYATFPAHIGLLAYYEDVLNLRDALAKLYTPIDCLYYKLRNVQYVGNGS